MEDELRDYEFERDLLTALKMLRDELKELKAKEEENEKKSMRKM